MDPAANQRLVEARAKADRNETIASVREGLADVLAGRSEPARAALKAQIDSHELVSLLAKGEALIEGDWLPLVSHALKQSNADLV